MSLRTIAHEAVDEGGPMLGEALDELLEAKGRIVECMNQPPDHIHARPKRGLKCTQFRR